jgi:glycosidase
MAINKGLNEPFGWEEGLRRIESTLSHDILYHNPYNNVTHLDNHDLSRFYGSVGENFNKWKMGMSMLLTLRGIPQIYYGSEILMKKFADPDAWVREDFPGGWASDRVNKFEAAGRSDDENKAFNFIQNLLVWRKNNPWFGSSKLTQFVPMEDTWVYFRYDEEHTLMCVYSTSQESKSLALDRYAERIRGASEMKNILTGETQNIEKTLTLAPMSVGVYELR